MSDNGKGYGQAAQGHYPARCLHCVRMGGADMIRAWNALVCRAWYAAGCPPRFALRQIGYRFAWADVRAGYLDARRTASPEWRDGRRIGGLDYAIGYAVGALS